VNSFRRGSQCFRLATPGNVERCPLSALCPREQPSLTCERDGAVKLSHATLNRHDLYSHLRGITSERREGISFPIILATTGPDLVMERRSLSIG